jgi:hypothetical protein
MRTLSAAVIVFVLATPGESAAHRLDEYLQAARVSLDRERVMLEVDLTPGASVAPAVIAMIDLDGDGAISPAEAAAYGQTALGDLVLDLDGRSVSMTLTRAEVPSIGEMLAGAGAIQLRAVGAAGPHVVGRRVLRFQNNHHPRTSVYLVNALVPEDEGVAVLAQIRDPSQRSVRIEYQVRPRWHAQLGWMILASAALSTLAGLRAVRGRPSLSRFVAPRTV